MRAEALAAKLQQGQTRSFWRDVRALCPRVCRLAQRVDGAVGDGQIAELWKEKYSQVLNSVVDEDDRQTCVTKLKDCASQSFDVVCVDEVREIVKNLSLNKSVGLDGNLHQTL